MMLIDNLIKKINDELLEGGEEIHKAVTNDEINRLFDKFHMEFSFNLPEIYRQLLSLSNGILFNGLTIWPTKAHGLFHEGMLEANVHLKESYNTDCIFFGTRDDELYIYQLANKSYQAIEYVGEAKWNEFNDAQSMFEFMLSRSLD